MSSQAAGAGSASDTDPSNQRRLPKERTNQRGDLSHFVSCFFGTAILPFGAFYSLYSIDFIEIIVYNN